MTVIKSEMEEWTRFKQLFETSSDPRSRSLDEDDDRNFSTVGAELYLDHTIASREPSNVHYTNGYSIERSRSVSREPSGILYTDENEIESPQLSFAMSDLQFTRTNSLFEDQHPLDDDDDDNHELSIDCVDSDWFDESISSDEALDSATGYKTATPSSSLESDEVIIEKRAASCVEFGNDENEKDLEYENEMKQHLRWFGHGKSWTLIAILVSWAGVVLSAYSRNSLQFVTLDEPLLIDSNFDHVESIGMVRIQVCYNKTVVGLNGCQIIDLSPEIVNDSRFEAARILLTLGLWFGIFFATVLSTAIYWESINLRPIGFGLLFTYFCQSCAMLFFDTELCNANKCRPGAGCICCIVASFCWITACGATARMDKIKSGHARRRRRQALREANKAAKAIRKKRDRETRADRKKLERETSSATEQTASTSSSNSSQHTADIESGEDNELQIVMRNMQLNRKASLASEISTAESAILYEC
jgi:hypothetical protein